MPTTEQLRFSKTPQFPSALGSSKTELLETATAGADSNEITGIKERGIRALPPTQYLLDDHRIAGGELPEQATVNRYLERIQAGDEDARSTLWLSATAYVSGVVQRVPAGNGLPYKRKLQIGMSVVGDAIDRYDPEQGPFGTWIGQRVHGAIIDEMRVISRTNTGLSRKQYKKLEDAKDDRTGLISDEKLHALVEDGLPEAVFHVQNGILDYKDHLSTDVFMARDEGTGVYEQKEGLDKLKDPEVDVEEEVFLTSGMKWLVKALKELPERQKDILIHSEGLFGAEQITLRALGKRYNVSESRACQIKTEAINKLRSLATAAA